jgi:hypothetical protein
MKASACEQSNDTQRASVAPRQYIRNALSVVKELPVGKRRIANVNGYPITALVTDRCDRGFEHCVVLFQIK